MTSVLRHSLPLALLLPACGGSGEAADPGKILGEDLNYRGVDGNSPNPPGSTTVPPAEQPASESDCQRAAENLVALGYDMAIEEEPNPDKQEQLRAERSEALQGENARELVRTWTSECLQRGDTKAETDCVASLKSERDIARCDPGP